MQINKWQRWLLFIALILLAACQPAEETVETVAATAAPTDPPPTATELPPTDEPAAPTDVPPTVEPTETVHVPVSATPRPTPAPIDDEEATMLMYELAIGEFMRVQAALNRVLEVDDRRFVPVFLELFRINQVGLDPAPYDYWAEALSRLTEQSFGLGYNEWIEWYGTTGLTPPPGFTTWKGVLLSRIDGRFGEFLQDDHPTTIRPEEIQWGGVVVDGIPALDNPAVLTPAEATYIELQEPIFGISLNGEARAYPLRIIDWHEMANDVVGGVPVSLAYCTLCGAAVAYHGLASDGTTYTFGSSGFLYRSNKLMYDRQTNTLWNQLTGLPVMGELVGTEVTLELLPVVLTTWESWLAQHPETTVLDIETGFDRPYQIGSAYGDYFAAEGTMFPVWQRSDLLETKDQIYALTINGQPVAYPIELLAEERVVNDTVVEQNLVLISPGEIVEVDGNSRRSGPVTYTAGLEVRAYERGDYLFAPGEEPYTVVDEDGGIWEVTEEALVGPEGETLARINGHLAYWFGWFAFFPQTLLYGE